MAELARLPADTFASLKEIAERMHLSEGYLEEIAASLKKAKLITGKQGPGGGYRLAQSAAQISLAQILTALNGPIEIVDCQKGEGCPVAARCSSKRVWSRVQKGIEETLRNTYVNEIL